MVSTFGDGVTAVYGMQDVLGVRTISNLLAGPFCIVRR